KTTVKEIYDLKVSKTGDMIKIKIHANGYLYNMVRIIAGTLVYVGNGKIDKNEIEEIIASKDRKRAGITAPPEGLMLKKVFY
ncbi:MAG: tRNA pseudouridine(38-40) synthase TruA, partial [Clostridia bacterium]|nr:tRNA pseudouridine(38-40) synthase TruA [Clostridia bacterium]